MERSRRVGFSLAIVMGIAMTAIPFFERHMERFLAALLFDAGSLLAFLSLILLMIERQAHED